MGDVRPRHPAVYQVGLVLEGKRCLVVGGGSVAARKIRGLLECGAAVTVVAPEAHVALGSLAAEGVIAAIDGAPLEVMLRDYSAGEAARYNLVITATGNPSVDQMVFDDAERAGVWINSADDLAHCSFLLPAVVRDPPVSVAVSTSGTSPALATWIARKVHESLGSRIGDLANLLGEMRGVLKARGVPTSRVDWPAILDGPVSFLVARGRLDEARAVLEAEIASYPTPEDP
jgi:precorrin-2 dehydrogenase